MKRISAFRPLLRFLLLRNTPCHQLPDIPEDKMRHRLFALIAAGLLAGCASTDAPMNETAPQFTEAEKAEMSTDEKADVYNASVTDEEDRVICRRVTPTGSHRSKTICRTVSEAAVERDAAQETLRKGRGTSYKPGN